MQNPAAHPDSREAIHLPAATPAPRAAVVSIITPVLNGGHYFEDTCQSILSQMGNFELEWIIIDGGSTDGTLPLLQSLGDPRVRWVSESDNGQAGALNRGLKMARGDIIGWLNGDDLYTPGAIATVVDVFAKNSDADWVIGRCAIINQAGKSLRQPVTDYKNHLLDRFSRRGLLRINMISQPAVFWRRAFGQRVGPLDESLHFTMDYDLWLRMARLSPPRILPQTLANFRVHDQSKSRGGQRDQFEEGYQVALRHAGSDHLSRWIHRFNIEKIVWGYRALKMLGR